MDDIDIFDDGSAQMASQDQLMKMQAFVTQYSTQLRQIEFALSETLSEFWNPARNTALFCFLFDLLFINNYYCYY
jgi:hypothetical protein